MLPAPRKGPLPPTFAIEPRAYVCGTHVFDVIKPHVQVVVTGTSGKKVYISTMLRHVPQLPIE